MNRMDLFGLLPSHHRMEDARHGHALKALLDILSEQGDHLRDDIDRLWDDLFIETCSDWVIPYLGDLVGNAPLPSGSRSTRADVANTIYYRRRRGTPTMLDRLATDVTNWPALVVPGHQRLCWTQNIDHPILHPTPTHTRADQRLQTFQRHATTHLRDPGPIQTTGGPTDTWARTVDLRDDARAPAHPGHVAFHLCPVTAHPLYDIEPAPATPPHPDAPSDTTHTPATCYHLDPLGRDIPIYDRDPDRPRPLTRTLLTADLQAHPDAIVTDHLGPGTDLTLRADGTPIPAHQTTPADLTHWTLPDGAQIALDPELGRLMFHPDHAPKTLRADLHHGIYAPLGGGAYPRSTHGPRTDSHNADIHNAPPTPHTKGTPRNKTHKAPRPIQDALSHWQDSGRRRAVLRIHDNATYTEPLTLRIPKNGHLVLESNPGKRPLLNPPRTIQVIADEDGGRLTLDGLAIQTTLRLTGRITLDVRHCTLAPTKGPAITIDKDDTVAEITLDHTLAGPLHLPPGRTTCTARDTILDPTLSADPHAADGPAYASITRRTPHPGPGAPLRLERCTVLGAIHTESLSLCTDSLLDGPLHVQHLPPGCIRYSYLATRSHELTGYRCLPDTALPKTADAHETRRLTLQLRPRFLDRTPGRAGYARLHPRAAHELHAGASDGGPLGAHNTLGHTQRIADLRARLEESLPLGLRPDLIDTPEDMP